ncbi:hypothetical protein Q7P36_007468 [Cladosporium allicinum]
MFCRSGAKALRQSRCFSTTATRQADFTHAVIGGGAVGLAIARKLQQRDGVSTVLIEKHGMVGSETSSRNSEVRFSAAQAFFLKTRLCIQGKEMMYELCEKNAIPHSNCGKWIVAQTDDQMGECEKVHDFAKSIGVPIRYLPRDEIARREPEVRAEAGALESPTTGIIDSHSYMQFLHGDFENSGGDTALASKVTRVEPPSPGNPDWKIWTTSPGQSESSEEDTHITAETVINSAGLYACDINNMILPENRHRTQYYAKGNYFSYAKSFPKPSTLVYPAPTPGLGGLGTHLTLDMGGRMRFGPDVEWVDAPDDLKPTSDPERFAMAVKSIKSFLPNVDEKELALDYAGIRPKLQRMGAVGSGKGFQDFYIKKEEGYDGFVNLLGIESPGLTSSLAIAEEVHRILYG